MSADELAELLLGLETAIGQLQRFRGQLQRVLAGARLGAELPRLPETATMYAAPVERWYGLGEQGR
jgi:hypothetical protein